MFGQGKSATISEPVIVPNIYGVFSLFKSRGHLPVGISASDLDNLFALEQ